MKILVCVKQVPDIESPIDIDRDARWICEDDRIAFRMNRYDEYALEEAVLIKEARDAVSIDALSVGPERAGSTLKKSLEKGADRAIHILLEGQAYVPPAHVAALIAGYARSRYDLILTGVMAEDDMHCLVGPLVAAMLSLPCAASVLAESILPDGSTITAECELEGGLRETIVLPLPALLTIQTGINRPRYPSLSNVLRAKTQRIELIPADPGTASRSYETAASIDYPDRSMKGILIEGSPDRKAKQLVRILHEKSLL